MNPLISQDPVFLNILIEHILPSKFRATLTKTKTKRHLNKLRMNKKLQNVYQKTVQSQLHACTVAKRSKDTSKQTPRPNSILSYTAMEPDPRLKSSTGLKKK